MSEAAEKRAPLRCGYCPTPTPSVAWIEWTTIGRPKGAPVCAVHLAERDTPDNFGVLPTVRAEPSGCAYSRNLVESRERCDCPVCEASRYRRPMADAIVASASEVRAGREERQARAADPLAAARLDRDVAIATARDTENDAVARAAKARADAERNAEACYRAACQRVANEETRVRDMISAFSSMSDGELISALRMEAFRLSRTVNRMRADIQEETAVNVREMTRVLERRGVEIPRWKFQDRTVKPS